MTSEEYEEKGEMPAIGDLSLLHPGGDDISRQTLEFPTDLPMENEYSQGKYYVRACFPIYYKLIVDKLVNSDNLQFISVTGPSGIGKSVFGGYFFDRFRREHPEFTIITVAFSTEIGFIKAAVFEGDQQIDECSHLLNDFLRGKIYKTAGPNLLHLFDGQPTVKPKGRLVCFTDQDSSWHKVCAVNERAAKLWLPLWSPEELFAAATCLELNLTQDVIEERFFKFGGVARQCLATDENVVIEALGVLKSAIASMDVLDELRGLVNEFGKSAVHHHLCHHGPSREKPWFSAIRMASEYVSLRVLQKIEASEAEAKEEVLGLLHGVPGETLCRVHVFEMTVHTVLARGGSLQVMHLDDRRRSTTTLTLSSSEAFCFFNVDQVNASSLSEPYQIICAPNCKSIDSFYYPIQGQILFFQTLVASTRVVDGKDIVKTLEVLGLLEAAIQSPSCVVLIFIVPDFDGDKLTHGQAVQWDEKADSESIRVLSSIADEETEHLLSLNIKTVGDLRRAVGNLFSLQDEALKSGTGGIRATSKELRCAPEIERTDASKHFAIRVGGVGKLF